MDLESVAAELAVLPPGEFVARRAELAKAGREEAAAAAASDGATPAEGKAAGRELADAIKKLAKPSAAAWAVNLLATRRPGELESVVALGEKFRTAAEEGDAATLTSLSTERRTTLRRATAAALELAEQALSAPVVAVGDDGTVPDPPKLSAAVGTDIEQTLQAALADPGAAAAVRTGRLVRALASTGVEAVDLADAVGGPFTPPEPDDDDDFDDGDDSDSDDSDDADDDVDGDTSDETAGRGGSAKKKPAGKRVEGKGRATAKSGSETATSAGRSAGRSERRAERRAAGNPAATGTAKSAPDAATAAETAAAEAAEALAEVDRQLDELRELRRRAREQSDALGEEIEGLEARLADLTAELDDRRADREELEDRLDETDRQFGKLDRQRDRAARLAETTAKAAKR